MRIGFIGLGQMGSGMARSLLKAGHEVTVWNRSPAKAEEVGREGAQVAKSTPAGFAAPLALKDAKLVLAAAEANRVPMPVASVSVRNTNAAPIRRNSSLSSVSNGGRCASGPAIRDAGSPLAGRK